MTVTVCELEHGPQKVRGFTQLYKTVIISIVFCKRLPEVSSLDVSTMTSTIGMCETYRTRTTMLVTEFPVAEQQVQRERCPHHSMDWFKGKSTGNPHIQWENLWFPVDFPLNQSSDRYITDITNC